MFVVNHFLLAIFTYNIVCVSGGINETKIEFPESFINYTAENDLWSTLFKDCTKPTFSCVRNSTYKYLKNTLDYRNDVQFTNFLKFSKNSFDYDQYRKQFDDTSDADAAEEESPADGDEMSKSLNENAVKFLMTHDMEVTLPEIFFLGTTVKVSPRTFKDNEALMKVELIPKAVKSSIGQGRIFFKKIKKFVSQRLIYAFLAILLVIKLLAVKIIFVLPTIVGVAAAKKLILKVLLFLFPALHHLFKLCAYVPYGAKHHIHKHQISHIHEVSHGHHHHGSHHKPHGHVEIISPHAEGPPSLHRYSDAHKEIHDPYEGPNSLYEEPYFDDELISHRNDHEEKENNRLGQNYAIRGTEFANSGLPLTSTEINNLILKTEKEALIKARLQKEKQKIHQENLRLQEQLNKALKKQENLRHQTAAILNSKISQNLSPPKPNPSSGLLANQLFQSPFIKPAIAAELKGNTTRQRIDQGQFTMQSPTPQSSRNPQEAVLVHHLQSYNQISPQEDHILQYNTQSTENKKQNFEQNIYRAAYITFDPFYSPILENIDKILRNIDFNDEPCKERLICSMYKNPSKFSPHSNLLSIELSRDSKELQKPTTTNAAVIRFYRYVQAARDGQDRGDCLRLYPTCNINTEL